MEVTSDFSEVIRVVGEPKFYLKEVRKVINNNGQMSAAFNSQHQRNFERKEWRELHEMDGDLSVLGIPDNSGLTRVDGFDEFVAAVRAPRIRDKK